MRFFSCKLRQIFFACLIAYALPSCAETPNEPSELSGTPEIEEKQPKEPTPKSPGTENNEDTDNYFIEDLPSSEELDFSHIERIPCDDTQTNHLCYDKTAFTEQHADRIAAYRAWQKTLYSEGEELTDEEEAALDNAIDAVIEATHEILGKCNYYKDDNNQIRTHCPDDLSGLYACPHMWFYPEMFVMGGIRVHPDEAPICYEHIIPEPGGFCNIMGCSGEQVCTGVFSSNLRQDDVDDTSNSNMIMDALPVCVDPETCMALRESQGLNTNSSCYFSDRTTLSSDDLFIGDVDNCNALEEGMCAVNCPCEEPSARCVLISQERNVGVCTTSKCQSSQDCTSNETCIQSQVYQALPAYDWLFIDLYGHNNKAFEDCVDKVLCEDWRDLHGLSNLIYDRIVDCSAN